MSRRRVAGVAVLAGAAAAVIVLVWPTAPRAVLIEGGPPYPSKSSPLPSGVTPTQLPEQAAPRGGQEWQPWTLLAVDPDRGLLTVSWTNLGSTGCVGRPVAVHTERSEHAVRVGLISPVFGGTCTADAQFAVFGVHLARPVNVEPIYRLGG